MFENSELVFKSILTKLQDYENEIKEEKQSYTESCIYQYNYK